MTDCTKPPGLQANPRRGAAPPRRPAVNHGPSASAHSVTPEKNRFLKMCRNKDTLRGYFQSCHNGTISATGEAKTCVIVSIPRTNALKRPFPGGTSTPGSPVDLPLLTYPTHHNRLPFLERKGQMSS